MQRIWGRKRLKRVFKSRASQLILLTTYAALCCLPACEKDGDTPLIGTVGTYRLTESLRDVGSGGAQFEPVQSSRTITLNADSTFTSSFDLCRFYVEQDSMIFGRYTAAGRLETGDCPYRPDYETAEGALIVRYLCYEGCADKFLRVR